MDKHNLEQLDPRRFLMLAQEREQRISVAPAVTTAEPPANRLARLLHPARQQLVVTEVIRHNEGCCSYILAADHSLQKQDCAYFAAGQYLSVCLEIDGKRISRPYSISSPPSMALEGHYRITVKAVPDGICSNHVLQNWTVGTRVEASDPTGAFTYEPLRDAGHVMAVAGGSGITPFLSMAGAVADGDEDCAMTLLYCSRTADDILFREELDGLQARCQKLRVIYVLSEEQREGYEQGFADAELIRRYAPAGNYSVFVCGPQQMYAHLAKELPKLGLARKYIRQELHGEPMEPDRSKDTVCITVVCKGESRQISAAKNCTILRSLESMGITPPSRCRSGECGFCRSRLISGEIEIPDTMDHRRMADSKHGYIHPCCSFPLTDLVIEITE